MKKKTKRSTVKNAIIDPNYNLKSRSEELGDIDSYFHTLSPEDQKWMLKYTENFVNASLDRKQAKNNLITPTYTKNLIETYLKKFRKKNTDKEVIDFLKKYLIRNDNVPLKIIHDIFFEENEKNLLKLIKELKDALYENIKQVKKREVNKIIKLIEKEIYGVNNSRNRCIVTREKAGGSMSYIEDMDADEHSYNLEDALIAKIDLTKESDDEFDDEN